MPTAEHIPEQNTPATELSTNAASIPIVNGEKPDIFGSDAGLVARLSVIRADQIRRNGTEAGEAYFQGMSDAKQYVALLLGDLLRFDPDLELRTLITPPAA